MTDTDGMVANPKHLNRARQRLRRLQRRAARRRRPKGTEPSQRWLRTNRSIARAHARVVNARGNGLHQLTAALADRFGTLVVEDLNIAGLLCNRRLSRAIADTGWGELRRQLEYKARWRGGRVVVADRWYPRLRHAPTRAVVW